MIIRIQLISDRKTAIKLLNLPMSQAIKTLKDIIAVKWIPSAHLEILFNKLGKSPAVEIPLLHLSSRIKNQDSQY